MRSNMGMFYLIIHILKNQHLQYTSSIFLKKVVKHFVWNGEIVYRICWIFSLEILNRFLENVERTIMMYS
jgi:hypothetical protein